jgi:hypothetical protein
MADHPFVKPVIGILQGERPNAVLHQLRDRRQIVDRPFRQPSGNVRYWRIAAGWNRRKDKARSVGGTCAMQGWRGAASRKLGGDISENRRLRRFQPTASGELASGRDRLRKKKGQSNGACGGNFQHRGSEPVNLLSIMRR